MSGAIGYLAEVKRNIFDCLAQIAMSAADGAAMIARSGESKLEDRRPEEILLETYGQMVREYVTQILNVAAIAHSENTQWEVKGFEKFISDGLMDNILEYTGIQAANIASVTFKQEAPKQFVQMAGKTMNLEPSLVAKSLEEIDQTKPEAFAASTQSDQSSATGASTPPLIAA